jgi:hypothetical protein
LDHSSLLTVLVGKMDRQYRETHDEIMPTYICKDCTMSCSSTLPSCFTMEP